MTDVLGAQSRGTVSSPTALAMANREFRGIAVAQVTSECGDQIAAIALSYLVYTRSNSPFLAASTYAVTYVPWVFGSILLAPLVDRLARRAVMVVCDLGRAVTIGVLALATTVHHMPIPILIALVLISSCFSAPYAAARAAILPDIFEVGPGYVGAVAISRILQQIDSVFGFALGGLIVAAVSPSGALAIDSGTFAVSCLVTLALVRERPAVLVDGRANLRSLFVDIVPNFRLVLKSRTRRAMLLLSAAALLFLIAPEGLAVAYAREHGHGAVAAGLRSTGRAGACGEEAGIAGTELAGTCSAGERSATVLWGVRRSPGNRPFLRSPLARYFPADSY